MSLNRVRRKESKYVSADRAVAAAVFLMVTIVCLLIGFSGPSVDFKVPSLVGWIYIGIIIVGASACLVRLFCLDRKWKRGKGPD